MYTFFPLFYFFSSPLSFFICLLESTTVLSTMAQKSLSAYAYEKVIQYEMMTAVYVMEPWEKTLFSKWQAQPNEEGLKTDSLFNVDAVLLIIVSLSLATFYQYTPIMLGKIASLFWNYYIPFIHSTN